MPHYSLAGVGGLAPGSAFAGRGEACRFCCVCLRVGRLSPVPSLPGQAAPFLSVPVGLSRLLASPALLSRTREAAGELGGPAVPAWVLSPSLVCLLSTLLSLLTSVLYTVSTAAGVGNTECTPFPEAEFPLLDFFSFPMAVHELTYSLNTH